MSRIDDLIGRLCPDGVKFEYLGEIAELVRGNGMPKSSFTNSGVGCIHYGQIYTHYGVWTNKTISHVAPKTAVPLAKVDTCDIIVTNTSENIEDVCKAVAWLGESQIVTGGHATVIKHQQDPKYLSYYFRTPEFFAQKKKLATGTKVIDVSAKSLAKIRVPIPPLEIQREIVKALDAFTELEAELAAELEARRRQYKYYRDALLSFAERASEKRLKPLGEIATLFGGLIGKSKSDFSDGNARFVSYMNVLNNIATDIVANDFVKISKNERQHTLQRGDILFTGSSETANEVGMSSVVTVPVWEPLYLNSFCIGCRLNDPDILYPGFSKHLFRSEGMRKQIVRTASGVTRFNVSKARLAQVKVPIPPLPEQKRIATILDKFDALVNDLTSGLPAEIKARRQQYEYYRDRLLTFREAA